MKKIEGKREGNGGNVRKTEWKTEGKGEENGRSEEN